MTSQTLEQRLTEGPEQTRSGASSREFLADTTACVTFGWVVGGLNETFVIASNAMFWVPMYEALLRYVVGVTDEQALYSARVSATTLCAVTGWPLNAYKRHLRGLFGCNGNIEAKCDENVVPSG